MGRGGWGSTPKKVDGGGGPESGPVGHWLSKDAKLFPLFDTSIMATSTTFNLETLLETLRSATEEQRAEIATILHASAAPAPSTKKAAGGAGTGVGRPKKATLAPAPLPEVEDAGEAPEASDYRLPEDSIREDVCVGRSITEANKDKRWSIAVYREAQCGGETVEDGELCETCARRAEAYATTPKAGAWCGRVTEEPLPWMHMLGTAWAAAKIAEGKLKWRGEDGTASVTGSESSAGAATSKAAEKLAAKAAREAEKLATKAAKEAEKAATKAAKEAEKAATKAAKEAEKATKPKAAPKPKKAATESTGAGGGAAATAVPAKADAAAAVSATDGEIKYIGGETYWVRGEKVYEYDMLTEAVGAFLGRLKADGETIDGEADEDSDEE